VLVSRVGVPDLSGVWTMSDATLMSYCDGCKKMTNHRIRPCEERDGDKYTDIVCNECHGITMTASNHLIFVIKKEKQGKCDYDEAEFTKKIRDIAFNFWYYEHSDSNNNCVYDKAVEVYENALKEVYQNLKQEGGQ
jgi:hypothetical protein